MVVATTGLLFCLFLLAHLANNFVIYTGAENFNFLVKSLEKIKPLIRLAEVMLVLILGGHIYNSITLALKSKKSKGNN
jgi:succinate dehydrogenase/fumarate reductase cytochrome b subunit